MTTITLQHYVGAPVDGGWMIDGAFESKPRFAGEHPLNVAEVEVTKGHGMDGQSGIARTADGQALPVSRLYQQGYDRRWVSCINDDTGQRWS